MDILDPDDGARAVGEVAVLEVPEEEVAVLFGGDFDVTVTQA